ncbi:SMP-30/gluconolactonase/LRE family protein [Nonomuraea rubra]|uniref:Sugar lactone lactonase YvrE n=1 Tax=Nonomuraea rubra TaxID=46180 RepID=A0A7X0P268_9ACTN|nr:SMP-30/gluconolactonase/LRE family protein [Nonomuraea rubra]MBB6553910.1 sugar lactone lactonase YvrE [Nonomuraea rubra]
MRRFLQAGLALVVLLAGYLMFWPTPVDPVAWDPPADHGLTGAYSPNDRLAGVTRLARGHVRAPDAVTFDREGRMYTSSADGKIYRMAPDGTGAEVFSDVGGRPTGMAFAPDGALIAANEPLGALMRIPPGGGPPRTLTDSVNGRRLSLVNDVTVAADGTVYFTESSSRFHYDRSRWIVLEHAGDGAVHAYDPRTRRTRVVRDGLQLPNGITLSADGTHLLVSETGAYQVIRHWLSGPRAGATDTLAGNLPGYPNDISPAAGGGHWVALMSLRSPLLDGLGGWPGVRRTITRLPYTWLPEPAPIGFVIRLDAQGTVTANLQDSGEGAFTAVSAVTERDGALYLGTETGDAVGRVTY